MAESTATLPATRTGIFEPLTKLRTEIDRMFEEFPMRTPVSAFRFASTLPIPAVEMSEGETAYNLSVELPGMKAADIDLTVQNDSLIISGEKKEEREEKDKDYILSERSYGSFKRRIPLPKDADTSKVEANATDGVLKIVVPKSEAAIAQPQKIEIKTA